MRLSIPATLCFPVFLSVEQLYPLYCCLCFLFGGTHSLPVSHSALAYSIIGYPKEERGKHNLYSGPRSVMQEETGPGGQKWVGKAARGGGVVKVAVWGLVKYTGCKVRRLGAFRLHCQPICFSLRREVWPWVNIQNTLVPWEVSSPHCVSTISVIIMILICAAACN